MKTPLATSPSASATAPDSAAIAVIAHINSHSACALESTARHFLSESMQVALRCEVYIRGPQFTRTLAAKMNYSDY